MALVVARAGRASERPLLGGRTARFRAAGPRRRALVYFAGDAAALAALGDPRCPARSIFRLTASETQFTEVDLPCANWHSTSAHGFVYGDRSGSAGGVRRILLGRGVLLVKLGGGNVATIRGPVPFAEAALTVGTERVCGRFDAFKKNTAARSIAAAGSGPCHPRPNFIVVNLDDARADGIDRMAIAQSRVIGEGVQFSESFVPDPLCCPSRASMFSGLYAIHHRTRQLAGPIGGAHVFRETGDDQRTIAVWLHGAGYRTGLFGKYLNAYSSDTEGNQGPGGTFYVPPGWDRWRGMRSTEHYGGVLGPTYVLVDERGAQTTYDDHTTDAQYSTDLLGGEVRTFIADAVSAGRSFFAYYAPYAPHVDSPDLLQHPAVRHAGLFASLPPWRPASWLEADVSDKPRWVQSLFVDPIRAALTDLMRQRAYESLLSVDEQIGAFLDQLETLGIADDTVVILTSDNGVTWGEHRFFGQGKECPYEEAIRVPLAVRYPRRVSGPAVRDAAVLNLDVPVTVAALADVPIPTHVDGASFDGWLTGAAPTGWRTDFLLEHWRGDPRATLTYGGQPADGDTVRLLYGNPWARPRAATDFEFDAGNGVVPGHVPVPIGSTADDTFATLASVVVATVPSTSSVVDPVGHVVRIIDTGSAGYGVQFIGEVDQQGAIAVGYPLPDYFGVRDVANRYAYVEYETGELELYDLSADPGELTNVADDPAYAGQRARLAQRLQEFLVGVPLP